MCISKISKPTAQDSLQCRRIWGARVHIFVLGRHLGFSDSGGLGRGDIRLSTNPLPVKHPVTIHDGGNEAIYLAFRISHNACTAG